MENLQNVGNSVDENYLSDEILDKSKKKMLELS